MKITLLISILGLVMICRSYGQTDTQAPTYKPYVNERYKFSLQIPNSWTLYGQIKNDTINNRAIVGWGLPKIYSEIEKTNIENSISVTAYQRKDITSTESLILFEYLRVDPTETALELDKLNPNARMIYMTRKGLQYKGKSYFIFKNGIGYIVNFMATPGTFDKNILKFEDFYTKIQIL